MKKYLAIALLAISTTMNIACKKDEEPTTGDLRITAKNELGTRLSGKTVYLYTSQANLDNFVIFKQGNTDPNGLVQFNTLAPQKYYFDMMLTDVLGDEYWPNGSATVIVGKALFVDLQP